MLNLIITNKWYKQILKCGVYFKKTFFFKFKFLKLIQIMMKSDKNLSKNHKRDFD